MGSEPGAILANRAAAVAETAKKKKKSGDKALELLKKAFEGKAVKEEPDYDDYEDDESRDE